MRRRYLSDYIDWGLVTWIVLIVGIVIGLAIGMCDGAEDVHRPSRERVDLFDAKGQRTGYANIDRQSGRIDIYDRQSNRTGWGQTYGSGRTEIYDLKGQRQGSTVIPLPPRKP